MSTRAPEKVYTGTFHDKEDGKSDKCEDALSELDHLQRLGVNVMEVMSSAQFPGELSWGYNPPCIFARRRIMAVWPALSGFIKAVHRAGLAVILDVRE